MVKFNLEVNKVDFEKESVINYELYIDLEQDCASFRILMSKPEFEKLKSLINKK